VSVDITGTILRGLMAAYQGSDGGRQVFHAIDTRRASVTR